MRKLTAVLTIGVGSLVLASAQASPVVPGAMTSAFGTLGGIDPVHNRGVYEFKRQTGAREVELLGQWDWASSPLVRWLGNQVIRQKGVIGRLKPYARGRLGGVWPPAAMKWFSDTMIYCPAIG